MNNKKYKDYIQEMAHETGISSSKSRKSEWDRFYKEKINIDKSIILIRDRLGSNKFSIYKVINVYFLVDDKFNYQGHIELSCTKQKICSVTDSNSLLKGGFYSLMFSVLLSRKGINEILSDKTLSTQAIKSYIKISKGFSAQIFDVKIKIGEDEYIQANKDNIKIPGSVFSVRDRNKNSENSILETFNEFDKRFEEKTSWYNWYQNGDKDLDMVLFMEKVFKG